MVRESRIHPSHWREPVKPLPIDYEPDFEETIARVVGRLTELGDLVDGVIEPDEMAEFMRDLHAS